MPLLCAAVRPDQGDARDAALEAHAAERARVEHRPARRADHHVTRVTLVAVNVHHLCVRLEADRTRVELLGELDSLLDLLAELHHLGWIDARHTHEVDDLLASCARGLDMVDTILERLVDRRLEGVSTRRAHRATCSSRQRAGAARRENSGSPRARDLTN